MRAHLNDPGWFQVGSYAKFDRQARDILDGRQRLFWIDDPARTDLAQYPPAFPALVAFDLQTLGRPFCILGADRAVVPGSDPLVAVDWRYCSHCLWIARCNRERFPCRTVAALCTLCRISVGGCASDVVCAWRELVVAAGAATQERWFALAAGVALGIACWLRVNPLYLCVGWAVALFVLVKDSMVPEIKIGAAVLAGTVVVIAPIVIRNYIVFPDFTPTGGTIGANLWEGLGETELGRQHGFLFGDDKMLEVERARMGRPGDPQVEMQFPDGIRRDSERMRESLAFIRQHPIWYLGVMLGRMWGMLKVAGDPVPYTGISGINVTSAKCLPPHWQGGVLALRRECTGNDSERDAVSFSAFGCIWNLCRDAKRLADELFDAGDDTLLSRSRNRCAHGDPLRVADARVLIVFAGVVQSANCSHGQWAGEQVFLYDLVPTLKALRIRSRAR